MQVFPDTVLRIHKGCPCDPDYEHTINIGNKEGQHAYFTTITKYRLNDMSYQRPTNGRIRVPYNVNDLYDCNYISFQNTAFGNKWFYAFIDSVEYVNNTTSEINYTIDVLQTWMYDIDLTQCFVAREHSVTDGVGDNLISEPITFGDYTGEPAEVVQLINDPAALFRNWCIVVVKGLGTGGTTNIGGFYGRLYSQAEFETYPATEEGIAQLQEYWNDVDLSVNQNAVITVLMMPQSMVATKTVAPTNNYFSGTIRIPKVETLKRSDGTNVHNNKLMTYPYTYLEMSNLQGEVKEYRYEMFNDGSNEHSFHCFVDTSTSPTFVAMPNNYNGNDRPDADERITLTNFPMCTWAVGDFINKLANLSITGTLAALTGSIGAIAGSPANLYATRPPLNINAGASGLLGNTSLMVTPPTYTSPIGVTKGNAGLPAIQGLTDKQALVAQYLVNNAQSRSSIGSSVGGQSLFNAGWFTITRRQRFPLPEYIDMIDDYFTRYGYACKKIKVPNIDSRPHWNYVQTVGCKVNGSIPCNDERLICAIFDKGVTFWKNPAEVGNFSLDNSPA